MEIDSDVLIIGGGPGGLSAAMSLGRLSRSVIVCDDERPRNAAADHMNNFPSHDGLPPEEWRRQVRKDLEKYKTVQLQKCSVLAVAKEGGCFRATLSSGKKLAFRKLILAYGVLDRLPAIPGLSELWGKSVFHCPYCHGFEVRGARLGLVANGPFAEHLLPLIYALSQDLVLFTNGDAELAAETKTHLKARKIKLVEAKISSLVSSGDHLHTVVLETGARHEREGLFWAPSLPFQSKSQIGEALGCEKTETGHYKVNSYGKTTVPGVFAAGDIAAQNHSVLGAAAAGQLAGAAVVSELLNEDFAAS